MQNVNMTFVKCTQDEYDALETKNQSTFYITTDTNRMYLGSELFNIAKDEESFYGTYYNGFLITKSFNSIASMRAAFAQGDSYTDVNYGEYVIISIQDGDNPTTYAQDNGKIFRRGFNFTDENAGAQYITKFSGPAGPPSTVDINSTAAIKAYAEQHSITPIEGSFSISNGDLVPGKTINSEQQEEYNDSIDWTYYHAATANGDNINLGLKLPYPTFDVETETTGSTETFEVTDESETDENGKKVHPFHTKIKIKFPQSAHGDSIRNLRIINASANDGVDYGTLDPLTVAQYRDQNTPILVYDRISYDENAESESTITYVSPFKVVENIDITEDGHLRFWLPYESNGAYVLSSTSVIPEITNITLSNDGQLGIVWRDFQGNETTKTFDAPRLKWINQIDYTSNGGLQITWNTLDENDEQETTTISPSQTFITDIIVYNQALYKTFIGINQEISTLTGISLNDLPEQTDDAVNGLTSGIGTYHKEVQGEKKIWYKKVFDFNLLGGKNWISID